MKPKNFINTSLFKELFLIEDGLVKHQKILKGSHVKVGDIAGTLDSCGYLRLHVKGVTYSVHRQLYAYYHNIEHLPDDVEIDHIDNNKLNNSKENLRTCTRSDNMCNQKYVSNSTGIKGITVNRTNTGVYYRAWVSYRKLVARKSFPYTDIGLANAQEWVILRRTELHGEFANHGK